ncbi:Rib/alpha-like domain-containing protein [Corynebacterium comes]|uniref:Rib/alpha-like repeat protein n=1 Tax=Corynebacterium comes TaxID=2675218 RepID=A0A6B8VDY1_9CORY|nr:Rib/alpha-like domain-containing protein [Corynebacterium comes]QGU03442.1 Rib/alpha-like repeat protein [Corynebacterium comes]
MLPRKLFSVFVAAAVSGALLAAPATAEPTHQVVEQTDADKHTVTYHWIYVMHGETATSTPVEGTDLPAGTVVTFADGAAVESLRAEGWDISLTDNVLSVTPPVTVDGSFEIPLLVTYPDNSTETVSAEISVDYYVDIPDWVHSTATVMASSEPLWGPHYSPFEQSSAFKALDESSRQD